MGFTDLLARMFPDRSGSVDWGQMRVVDEMIRIADELMYRAKMTECRQCGYRSRLNREFVGDVCPQCGSSALIPGGNRIMAF